MARKLRVEFPGALYHVMNRGDRREAIFKDDKDRQQFVETLEETCAKTGWQVHVYCLMPNHFHLVLETPQANLVAGMKWFLGTYTGRFNRRHKLSGHLFSGRYKALVVEGSGNGYLRTVSEYVHLNPARAHLIKSHEPLRAYRWSSWPEYIKPPSKRADWLRVDRVLGEYQIPQDSVAGRRRLERVLEERRGSDNSKDYWLIRRGWCFGEERFRKELLEQVSAKTGKYHYGEELKESAEGKAERLVAEELKRRGWEEAELAVRRKGAPEKVMIAQRLRRETTMTLDWITNRLQMGTKTHLSHLLYWHRREMRKA